MSEKAWFLQSEDGKIVIPLKQGTTYFGRSLLTFQVIYQIFLQDF